MSGKVSGLVWDLALAQNEKFVLLAYADKADHEGRNAHPGVGLVAWMTGYSEDSVRRITRDLINKRGLLEVQERGGGGMANKFRVCMEKFKNFERPPRQRRGRPKAKPQGPENPPQENPPQNNGGLNGEKTPITAMHPQRPSTTSVKNPSDTNVSSGQDEPASFASWEGAKTGEKQAYLIAYLHNRCVERGLDPPTPRQKERLSGELRTHIQRDRSKADLLFALDHMVEAARRGVTLELYQALSDADGKVSGARHLRVVEDKPSREGGGLESLSDKMKRLGVEA